MAIGQKYIKITEWLVSCGKSKVRLTFQQLDELSKLPKSAYSTRQLWANSGQSFSSSWLSAHYKVTAISMSDHWVEFTMQPASEFHKKGSLEYAQPQSMGTTVGGLLLHELIDCGHMCIDAMHADPNHRYRSWEYCYKVFSEPCDFSRERLDYLSLHLAWYLGSWGMLRNSFLQNKDYKIHIPAVRILIDAKWEKLRGLSSEAFLKSDSVDMILNLAGELTDNYQKYAGGMPTATLLTKIILGTIGCVPAYDRYFTSAVRKTGIASGIFGKESLLRLGMFYQEHQDTLEMLRGLCPSENVSYPPAKVLDMCFFEYGFKHSA